MVSNRAILLQIGVSLFFIPLGALSSREGEGWTMNDEVANKKQSPFSFNQEIPSLLEPFQRRKKNKGIQALI